MEGSIYKTTRKVKGKEYIYYIGQFYVDNIRYTVSAKTETECMQKMLNKKNNVDEVVNGRYMFVDWVVQYIKTYKKSNQQRTINSMLAMVERLRSSFGKIELSKFNINQAQELMNMYNDKNNTQRKLYMLLRSAMSKAVLLGYIDKNVFDYVEIKKYRVRKHRAYEFEEQNKIMDLLYPKYRSTFYFLCCTCMRIGEFLAFDPKTDIDYDRHKLIINKRKDIFNNKIYKGTKNGDRERRIDYLDELFVVTKELGNGKLPFGRVTYSGFKSAMQRVLAQLGIEDCLIHTTRHTGLSVGHYCKIDDIRLQSWAGHSSLSMTKDTYTNLLDKGSSPILEYYQKLAKIFD